LKVRARSLFVQPLLFVFVAAFLWNARERFSGNESGNSRRPQADGYNDGYSDGFHSINGNSRRVPSTSPTAVPIRLAPIRW
jgi:hypothetical protein